MQLYLMMLPANDLDPRIYYCFGYSNLQRSPLYTDINFVEYNFTDLRIDSYKYSNTAKLQILGPLDDTRTIQEQYPELFI